MDLSATELKLSATRHVRDYLRRILEGREGSELALNNMGLQDLPVVYANANIWHALTHLEVLNLENNLLCELEMVADLVNLKTLLLQGNQLQVQPASASSLARSLLPPPPSPFPSLPLSPSLSCYCCGATSMNKQHQVLVLLVVACCNGCACRPVYTACVLIWQLVCR